MHFIHSPTISGSTLVRLIVFSILSRLIKTGLDLYDRRKTLA
jgi:hypothetical protein